MDILKAFSLFDPDRPINVQGTQENPLFQANQVGELLGIVNINKNLQSYDGTYKTTLMCKTNGGMQQHNFLTERGLYRLVGRSRKPIAEKFQEWIFDVVKEFRIKGVYKLQEEREIDRKLFKRQMILNRSNILKEAHNGKNIVYICKMKDCEKTQDKFIIKIGSTQNIKERLKCIEREYNITEPILLDVIECNSHTKLENMIHKDITLQSHKYDNNIKKNSNGSRETYIVTDELYEEFLKIIKKLKLKISDDIDKMIELEKLKIENEIIILQRQRLEIQQKKIELDYKEKELDVLKNKNVNYIEEKNKHSEEPSDNSDTENSGISSSQEQSDQLSENDDVVNEEKDPDDDEEVQQSNRQNKIQYVTPRNNSLRVPKVCQYSTEDLKTPIRIYDSPIEVERLNDNVTQHAMRLAYLKNTIYKGYRWLYIKRNEEPPAEIPPTVISNCKSTEVRFIAMIDVKRTKILQVFATQKEAVEARNLKCNSFTRAIQKQSLSSGHYWNFFDACPIEWREEYLKTNQLPEKHIYPTGKIIQQIDPITMKVIETFRSKRDVVRRFQVSYNKLGAIVNTDELYSGHYWKEIEDPQQDQANNNSTEII